MIVSESGRDLLPKSSSNRSSRASGRGSLPQFPRPYVAHQLADMRPHLLSDHKAHGMAHGKALQGKALPCLYCQGYERLGQSNLAQIVRAV